jgi:hypothetical protein
MLSGLAGCSRAGSGPTISAPTAVSPPSSPPPAEAPPAETPPPVFDALAPTVPGNLTATALSPTDIRVAWTSSTDNVGVAGYRLYRDGSQVATTTGTSHIVTSLAPASTYRFTISAYDAAGNASPLSAVVSATTPVAPTVAGKIIRGGPDDYLSLLGQLKAGDTLILQPGSYDDPNGVPGLPIFNMHGEPGKPITIMGEAGKPRPVLLGRSTHNTVRFDDASHVVVRNIEIDGRDLGGDGVNSQGVSHDITLEDLYIHGVGENRQIVGISTKDTVWNWTIRRCVIAGAGTGMYLGSSDGSAPFIAGVVEYNMIRDTRGYNIEIKHQNPRPSLSGMPQGTSATLIRHNVFNKSANSESGDGARPNLLVGHFPLSGNGADDMYEIYGNFFYQNPIEALFQGEGNIAFHHNLLVNDTGDAVNIQPHNDVPKRIFVFQNTVVAAGSGIRVSGGASGYPQQVIGNAVFASVPISGGDQRDNVTDSRERAAAYLGKPTAVPGALDLYPRSGQLVSGAMDTTALQGFRDWNRDFNGTAYDARFRGAYSGAGINPGWLPRVEIKPTVGP